MVITLYQHDIVWNAPEANRLAVEQHLRRIADNQRPDLVVLPETFTTGFGGDMTSQAEPAQGPTLQWAQRMAEKHGLMLVGTWLVHDAGRVYNRLHWVYPDGSYGHYDKAHAFRVSGEADHITCGTRRPTFEYQGLRIRPAVCYDLRFPLWLRNGVVDAESGQLDYDLLLICANWPASRSGAWTTLLKARAIENLCYVAGCNRTGLDGMGGHYSGDSLVVDYKGFALAPSQSSPSDGNTLTATIDKAALLAFRRRWPFYLDNDPHPFAPHEL